MSHVSSAKVVRTQDIHADTRGHVHGGGDPRDERRLLWCYRALVLNMLLLKCTTSMLKNCERTSAVRLKALRT